MSDTSFKVGKRVHVNGKDVKGVIAYVGQTMFSPGKWIGVILDEPKGKNNGTVKGQTYFQCPDNYGMFVRQSGLSLLDEAGNPIQTTTPLTSPDDGSKSRSRLSSSRLSLTGSRQSLSGSHQSLTDSRTQLASPALEKVTDKEPMAPPTEVVTPLASKRASFIETGFVETLKPQFTPGQSIISPGLSTTNIMEDKMTNLQLIQENDNLRSQVKDLSEKLETLRIKRSEDKDKLKDYDKTKLHLEQLLEFKGKIMESHSILQRDLQRAKRETREAIEAREQHAEEMADLEETVEMATLDKEMAEEKAETLQIELETAKEKIEELTLDLEILKTEMQDRTSGVMKEGISAYEFKQMEQQNLRLHETLVRMRDLTAHEKHEYQKLQKDLDQKKSEIAELSRTKEKLSARVEEMEQQIVDLQEQVDAALGAEEMVEQLSDRKMALEDNLKKLEEELAELEALQDMNEQLVESNAELELDLREELDLSHAATREAIRERDAAVETIADREQTINKFRDLVQKLQEQSQELQRRLESESNKPVSALPEILDFKKMFAETKAHTKAIDLELRKIDVKQSEQHVKLLIAYMPDTFLNRGGDHDALLVLLLLPRLVYKSDILLGQIRDKFPMVEKIDRADIVRGHSAQQYTFRSRLSYYLYSLQTVLHRFIFALNTCKANSLLKVGGSYPEMAAQEKILDNFIDLLKRDQLDENVPTEMLEKCVNYLNTMFPLLLVDDDGQINHTQLLLDSVKTLGAAYDGINVEALILKTLQSSDGSDMGLFAHHIITVTDQIQQQLKLMRRRIPPDATVTNLGFPRDIVEKLLNCSVHTGRISKLLQDVSKQSIQHILVSGATDLSISPDKLKEFAVIASDKVYEQDDLGPVQSVKNSLALVLTQTTSIAQYLQDSEYDINVGTHTEEKVIPPIVLRAQTVKKELEETKHLTNKLETREADIKELKKLIKQKQEELSEMTIRKELAEKKLGNVNKDYELTIEKLERKYSESQNALKRKEKEFEETMDHLQADIDSLENEKGELKEKLKFVSKRAAHDMKSAAISQPTSLQSGSGASLPAIVKDSPLLLQEIHDLRLALKHEQNEKIKIQTTHLKKQLDNLKPLPVFKQMVKVEEKNVVDDLIKEANTLIKEIYWALATPKVIDISNRKPGTKQLLDKMSPTNHILTEMTKVCELQRKAEILQNRINAETLKRKHTGKVEADFAVFPSKEMTKALNEKEAVDVAEIKIPISKLNIPPKACVVPLIVNPAELRKIQNQFAF